MNNKQPVKPTQPVKKEAKTKVPSVETQLVGKRVRLMNNDWSRSLQGKLLKVEKYLYVVETAQGVVIVNKHSVGSITGAKEETES